MNRRAAGETAEGGDEGKGKGDRKGRGRGGGGGGGVNVPVPAALGPLSPGVATEA